MKRSLKEDSIAAVDVTPMSNTFRLQYRDVSLWSKLGVKYPLCDSTPAIANTTSSITEYRWIAPSEVTLISKSSSKLLNKEDFTVDIFVILPSELFGKRDYVNLVYPAKRSHYMCSCIKALESIMPDMIVEFTPGPGGDTVFQNLSISERTRSSQGRIILHFFATESSLAKSSRFSPSISNLRPSTVYPHILDKAFKIYLVPDNCPTPFFNQRLLRNMHECRVIQKVDFELQNKTNLLQALGLCNRWFHCRNMVEFDDIFLAAFMICLLRKEIVTEKQDLLTILRNYFLAIVNYDSSVVMGLYSSDFEETAYSLHQNTSPIVLLDYSGYWNIANGISLESFNQHNSSGKIFSFLLAFRINKGWSNPITMGPVATEPEAKSFCNFWKGKTQLRKFADTRICECMVWNNEPSSDVPLIVLRFLIANHFLFPSNCISWRTALPTSLCSDKITGMKIATAFSSLSSILRALKGLPLMITNIHGVSPFIRGTEPCPSSTISFTCEGTSKKDYQLPSLHKVPSFTSSITVHIKLEYSGKWGSDFEGIRRMTGAFYVQIAEQLGRHGLISVPAMDQLFVLVDDVVFKLLIVHPKVLKMLETRVEELRADCASSTTISLESKRLASYKKRWLSAKLLSNAIPDLALEMIMVAAFEQPTMPPPQAPIVAFYRCLSLLVNHNWSARPLIVDFAAEWKDEDLMDLQCSFVKMRPVLPPMVIITNEEPMGMRWTRDNPSSLLLKRIIGLASQTMGILNENIEGSLPTNMEAIFSSPLLFSLFVNLF
uniref:Nucleolar protein 6 n=1 Tax=Heterorhabditis bacteriophora TaxID=37862 RepID=A0A1I7XDU6_HETBA